MKQITRNNIIKLIKMMKEYQKTENQKLKNMINDFINNVINKDRKYYSKLKNYNFDNETLKYLMWVMGSWFTTPPTYKK